MKHVTIQGLRRYLLLFLAVLAVSLAFCGRPLRAEGTVSDTEAETETDAETDAEPETGADAETGAEPETETDAEPETGAEEELTWSGGKLLCIRDGKRVRDEWVDVGTSRYYFSKNGTAAVGLFKNLNRWYVSDRAGRLARGQDIKIVTVEGKRYFADSKGHPVSGWKLYNGNLYYARGEEGGFAVVTDDTADRISFDAWGHAVESNNRNLKIKTMEIIASITDDSMDNAAKLRAAWNYVCSSRFSYFGNYPDMNDPNWPRVLAYQFFTQGGGNCYGFACSFSALAHEIGYNPVVVHGLCPGSRDHRADGLTRHCCLSINGAYYDPEGQYAGWAQGIYGTGGSSLVAINGTLEF